MTGNRCSGCGKVAAIVYENISGDFVVRYCAPCKAKAGGGK